MTFMIMPSCTIYSTIQFSFSKKIIEKVIFFVFQNMKKQGSVSVHSVGRKKIQSLNREYRGKDRITDVLSFGVEDEGNGEDHDWGDLFLCEEKIQKQAKEFGVTFEEEFLRMLIHGTLHLFGYDHVKESDAKVMFPLQEKLLSKVKIVLYEKRK